MFYESCESPLFNPVKNNGFVARLTLPPLPRCTLFPILLLDIAYFELKTTACGAKCSSLRIRKSKRNNQTVASDGSTDSVEASITVQVPIQFEFEIEVTKSHPHFKIGPLRGIVPANGAAEVYHD